MWFSKTENRFIDAFNISVGNDRNNSSEKASAMLATYCRSGTPESKLPTKSMISLTNFHWSLYVTYFMHVFQLLKFPLLGKYSKWMKCCRRWRKWKESRILQGMILIVPLSAGFLKGTEEEKCLAADLSEFNLFFSVFV